MSEVHVHPVLAHAKNRAKIDAEKYQSLYDDSIQNPEKFWAEQGKRLNWIKPYTKIKNVSFASADLYIKWYEDGVLNASANCLDRHLAERADQTCLLYTSPSPRDRTRSRMPSSA